MNSIVVDQHDPKVNYETQKDGRGKHPFDFRVDYGNLESNLKFLELTNVLNGNQKMLEIGSGKGRLLKHLRDMGYDAQGTEIELEYIGKAKQLYGNLPITFIDSDILPFEDNSFDVVMSFDVFEHISDTDKHLNEVKRVLKKDGYYLLQTPNKYTNIPFEIIRHKSLTAWKEDHVALHSYKGLIKRFKKNNFNIEIFDMPVVNDFFKSKIERYTGKFGLFMLKIINPDKLPMNLKTNFYIKAQKSVSSIIALIMYLFYSDRIADLLNLF